jgi:hypothetical protein
MRLCMILAAACSLAAFAQNIGSNLSGRVVDSQGLAVEGAKVVIASVQDATRLELLSGAGGGFQAPSLPPGEYSVTIAKPGFRDARVEGIRLTVGETRSVRAVLAPSSVEQQITVESSVDAVNTAESSAGTSFSSEALNLPIVAGGVGRNFRTQVYLAPGVTRSNAAHRPFAVSGARNRNNNYLLDSNDFNEIEGGLIMGRGSSEQLISVEALEGIQVLTHNYKAEYGRQNGSIVSMVTKRGTNDWRGVLYEYFRNNVLDARNTFDVRRLPLRFNQFGASISGPAIKNKTFVFGNFEGFIRRTANATTIQTLTPAQRAMAVDAVKPLVAMYPEPNIPGTNLYRADAPTGGNQWNWVGRVDHELTNNMRIFGRVTYLKSNSYGVAGAGLQRFDTFSSPQGYSIHHNWTPDSRSVNEARFNYTRFVLKDRFIDPVELGNPAINGEVGTVFVNGLSSLGQFAFMRRQTAQNNFQWTDDYSRVMGAHATKFGFAIRRMQLNSGTIAPGFTGVLRFLSIPNFLAGNAVSYNRNVGNPYIGQRATEYNFYAQDDWQIHPRLVLNLGLRYEYNTVPTEVNNLIEERYRFLPDRNNFAPRVGFAWRADRDGKTAVRGAYGIFYNVLELSFVGLTRFNPPLITNLVNANPRFPDLGAGGSQAIPSGLVIPQRDARQPYNQHLNFTIERQLFGPNATLSASYVGTIGLKAPRTSRPNGGDGMPQAQRPDRTTGVVNLLETAAASNYHGLQTQFQWRMRGVYLQASYTLSKMIDEVSDFPSSNQNLARDLLALEEANWRLNRGLSDFDVRHNANIGWSWELPWLRQNRWLGGWSLQGIANMHSGRPYTLYSGTDNLIGSNSNRVLDVPGTLTRFGGSNRQAVALAPGVTRQTITPAAGTLGTIGRNTEFSDSFVTFSVSAGKSFALSDRWRLEFRAESFNIANTVNYANPDGVLTSPNFGQAISAFDPRQIQLALRLSF